MNKQMSVGWSPLLYSRSPIRTPVCRRNSDVTGKLVSLLVTGSGGVASAAPGPCRGIVPLGRGHTAVVPFRSGAERQRWIDGVGAAASPTPYGSYGIHRALLSVMQRLPHFFVFLLLNGGEWRWCGPGLNRADVRTRDQHLCTTPVTQSHRCRAY